MKKEKIFVTEEGLRTLKEKLEKLEQEYDEITRGKTEVAETGGNQWHDNPAYDEVERRQTMLLKLIDKTKTAIVESIMVPNREKAENVSDTVEIGSTVEILLNNTKQLTVRIGGVAESNPAEGIISYQSPLGKALMGAREGEEREYLVGKISSKVRLTKIKR